MLSVLDQRRGDARTHVERADELLARWRSAVDELGDSIWLFAINFGFVALADDPEAAERDLRPWYEALRRIGEKSHFSSVAGTAGPSGVRTGTLRRGRSAQPEERTGGATQRHPLHILWRTARAQALAHTGELGAAEALAREAVVFAAESDFLDSHGEALTELAEVLYLADRVDEAASALEQAIQLHERKGNLLSAARARARLRALA